MQYRVALMCFPRSEIRWKFPPEPLSRKSNMRGLAGFLIEETGKPAPVRSFWRGVRGGPFLKKVLP
jgi:hypothetical protein